MSKAQPEYEFQAAVAEYLRRQYPDVFFLSDTVAFLKLSIPQSVRNKKIQCPKFHCPDLLVIEARRGFHGFFRELKAETPYRRDGTLKAGDHLQNQWRTIAALNLKGYNADFAWDWKTIKKDLDWYLK